MVLIAPSILSADFSNLEQEIKAVEKAGANWIHIDVMDGRFVPNITMGPFIVKAIKKLTKVPLDVHLMIEDPEDYVQDFSDAGADIISVHPEATKHLQRTLALIRSLGKKAGVALNPSTSESSLQYVAPDLDLVLVMTVNPGFSGQAFLREPVKKIPRIKEMLRSVNNLDCLIEVDGGMNAETSTEVIAAGADVLVAGSAIFNSKDRDYERAILSLSGAKSF